MESFVLGVVFGGLGLIFMAAVFDLTHRALQLCRRLARLWKWWPYGQWPPRRTPTENVLWKMNVVSWLAPILVVAIVVISRILLPNPDILLGLAGGKGHPLPAFIIVPWLQFAIAFGVGWGFGMGSSMLCRLSVITDKRGPSAYDLGWAARAP